MTDAWRSREELVVLVLRLSRQGLTSRQVARALGRSVWLVRRVIRAHAEMTKGETETGG